MSSLKKRARVFKILRDVKASYWFVPSLLIITSMILASMTEWIDHRFDLLSFASVTHLIDIQPEAARALLSVMAQSIIGVTGVMFSMTLVAVSFASGNFGPRLIDNFMRDHGNQWSLGFLISTFVFTVAILRSVHENDATGSTAFVPHLSIIIAILLSLICIFVIVYFIHHIPETINVSRISSKLSKQLDAEIRGLIDQEDNAHVTQKWPDGAPTYQLITPISGYLQTCDYDDLETLAADKAWFVRIVPGMGEYVTVASPIFAIWADQDLSKDEIAQLNLCYSVGPERTEYQNPTFISQQLVEMITRALSSGINDPYTAMDCLNRLAGALTIASVYNGGLAATDRPRLETSPLDFDALFRHAFPLCRQYIQPDDLTRSHAIQLLETLREVARENDKDIIEKELDALSIITNH